MKTALKKVLFGAMLSVTLTSSVQAANSQAVFAYTHLTSTSPELVINGSTTLSATNRGWWDQTGLHSAINTNYIAGFCGSSDSCDGNDVEYRNFFVFDLTSLSGTTISSAVLRAFNPSDGYINSNSSLTYSVWDVNSSISSVISNAISDTAIYDDLGTGTSFGSIALNASSNGDWINIALNSQGINSLQGSTEVAFGGAVSPVPEPETYAMMLAGLSMVGQAVRRKKGAAL